MEFYDMLFEVLSSNDGALVKRARVPGGYIYIFVNYSFDQESRQENWSVGGSCFVPYTGAL